MKKVASVLTESSGNLIDFFNIAGLLKQRTRESMMGLWTNYSWRELFIRGGIVATTAAFGLLAAETCKSEECSPLARSVSGAVFGFFVSHSVVLIPIIQRRNKIKMETKLLYEQINKTLDIIAQQGEFPVVIDKLRDLTEQVFNLKLPLTRRGDAIRNLMTIKNYLTEVEPPLNELYKSLNERNANEILNVLVKINESLEQNLYAAQEALLGDYKKLQDTH